MIGVYGLPEHRNDPSLNDGIAIVRPNYSYERGAEEQLHGFIGRIDAIIHQLENIGSTHIRWRTHKNPYGCWICECLQISRLLLNQLQLEVGELASRTEKKGKRDRKREG